MYFVFYSQVLRSTVKRLRTSRRSSRQRTNLPQRKSTATWHALRTRPTFSLCSTQSLTSSLQTTSEVAASTEWTFLLSFFLFPSNKRATIKKRQPQTWSPPPTSYIYPQRRWILNSDLSFKTLTKTFVFYSIVEGHSLFETLYPLAPFPLKVICFYITDF